MDFRLKQEREREKERKIKVRSIRMSESADGNFVITNVEARETEKEEKRNMHKNGIYYFTQVELHCYSAEL